MLPLMITSVLRQPLLEGLAWLTHWFYLPLALAIPTPMMLVIIITIVVIITIIMSSPIFIIIVVVLVVLLLL